MELSSARLLLLWIGFLNFRRIGYFLILFIFYTWMKSYDTGICLPLSEVFHSAEHFHIALRFWNSTIHWILRIWYISLTRPVCCFLLGGVIQYTCWYPILSIRKHIISNCFHSDDIVPSFKLVARGFFSFSYYFSR